jgi:hypothetical protein
LGACFLFCFGSIVVGGLLYEYTDKGFPFYVVAGVCCIQIIFQLYAWKYANLDSTHIRVAVPGFLDSLKPLTDPYILIVTINLIMISGGLSMLEFLLPIDLEQR